MLFIKIKTILKYLNISSNYAQNYLISLSKISFYIFYYIIVMA